MAFEGDIQTYAPTEVDEVGQIILKARELLSDPAKWCQRAFDDASGAMCTLTALKRVLADEHSSIIAAHMARKPIIARIAGHLPPSASENDFCRVITFNDSRETTHAMVLDLLDRAATNSTAQGD